MTHARFVSSSHRLANTIAALRGGANPTIGQISCIIVIHCQLNLGSTRTIAITRPKPYV